MKFIIFLLLLLFGYPPLVNADKLRPELEVNYNQLFSGKDWDKSNAFLNWAQRLPIINNARKKCSEETKKRLADSVDRILFCEQVATLSLDGLNESAELVWANLRRVTPSPYGHDCNAGMIYLGKKKKIIEDNPASCEAVQELDDPSDTPVMVFRVIQTREIGIVFDGHGAECGGRAVMLQKGDSDIFKKVYEFYWRCMH